MRLATRSSALALAQARAIADALGGAELVAASSDSEPGDKSRFVRGVERALLAGEADLGVHSAKDLPGEMTEGLALAGVPAREDPADAFIGAATTLDEVPEGGRIGTASLRRRSQLLALRPDLEVVELRGNVDTRLRLLEERQLDGIVLAAAGLNRLGLGDRISFRFGADQMVPAAGQGVIALQAGAGEVEAAAAAAGLTDRVALTELTAERAVVSRLDVDCDTPIGICARHVGDTLALALYAGLADGSQWFRDAMRGDPEQPVALADAMVESLRGAGGDELLARARAGEGSG